MSSHRSKRNKRTLSSGARPASTVASPRRSETVTLAIGALAAALVFLLLPAITVPGGGLTLSMGRGLIAGCAAALTSYQVRDKNVVAVTAVIGSIIGWIVLSAFLGEGDLTGLAGVAVAGFIAWAGVWFLERSRNPRQAQLVALALVLILGAYLAGVLPGTFADGARAGRNISLSVAPQPEGYSFDGQIYLRTNTLMEQGESFYPAFRQAVADDARMDGSSLTSPFNYRQPFLFYLWSFLPGSLPVHILGWFIVFTLVAAIAAYAIAARVTSPGPALLAPAAMLSFSFYFWWMSTWFAMAEVWASVFVLLFAAALMYKRFWLSLLFLVLGVATREFVILLVPALLIAWWVGGDPATRRRSWPIPALAVAAPIAVIALHVASAPVSGSATGINLATWMSGGITRGLEALRFGWDFLAAPGWLSVAIPVAALVGIALVPQKWLRWSLLAALVLPLLFLFTLSSGEWGYYWGAFITPLAAALFPAVFGRWAPPEPDRT